MKLALLSLIVAFAYSVGAATGFGDTVIAVTVASHLYEISFLVPALVVLNQVISLYLVARHYRNIDKALLLRWILPLALAGIPGGVAAFHVLKGNILKIVLGATVASLALLELTILIIKGEDWERKEMGKVQSALWIFGGGIIHGMYASGGALIAYYAARNIRDKKVFRSTLSALWLVLNSVLITFFAFTGRIETKMITTAGCMIPAVIVGIVAGEWLHSRIPEYRFRVLVFVILLLAGISVFV